LEGVFFLSFFTYQIYFLYFLRFLSWNYNLLLFQLIIPYIIFNLGVLFILNLYVLDFRSLFYYLSNIFYSMLLVLTYTNNNLIYKYSVVLSYLYNLCVLLFFLYLINFFGRNVKKTTSSYMLLSNLYYIFFYNKNVAIPTFLFLLLAIGFPPGIIWVLKSCIFVTLCYSNQILLGFLFLFINFILLFYYFKLFFYGFLKVDNLQLHSKKVQYHDKPYISFLCVYFVTLVLFGFFIPFLYYDFLYLWFYFLFNNFVYLK
jgi:hypothetical protein